LNLLTGGIEPDSGKIRHGSALEMVTIDQKREVLDSGATLQSALVGGYGDMISVQGHSRHVVGYMKDFLFTPEQARTPVTALSGGERGRLLLARAFARQANLLVLDEPTNDLDLETLDLLQEMLADFTGTVLLVSHDRDFLDRVVVSTVAYEGRGRWIEYAGGYSDMLAQRGSDLMARTDRPMVKGAPVSPSKPKPLAAPKARLSFKEKHALETLPKQMEELQGEIAKLQAVLSDPTLYARDPKAFAGATDRLTAASAALNGTEEEWLRLEMKREEIEDAG
jgi:ATP-binding cassette subfamily F protein uup